MSLVPSDKPEGLRQNILAAVKAHNLGLTSIDYVLKRYGAWLSGRRSQNPTEVHIKDMLEKSLQEVSRAAHHFTRIKNKPGILGLVLAGGALTRLHSSFRVASLLIRLGYVFESFVILRLILEQIAWAYAVHEMNDKETVLKVSSTKAITKLKPLLPWVGPIYGTLSNFAHIASHLTPEYIEAHEGDYRVTLISPQRSLLLSFILLRLADAFGTVAEYVYRESVPVEKYLEKDEAGEYRVKQSRPLAASLQNYRNILHDRSTKSDATEYPGE